MLRNAAEEAARTGLAWFDHVIGSPDEHARSLILMRGMTEEPEGPKKRARRPKRDPDMPKKPMTAYLLFCNEGRDKVKNDLGPDVPNSEVVAELTRRWTATPADEKKVEPTFSPFFHDILWPFGNIDLFDFRRGKKYMPRAESST
jgi:hypothetical protein